MEIGKCKAVGSKNDFEILFESPPVLSRSYSNINEDLKA